MVSETQLGEHIVGAYHNLVSDCEVVSYNQRSKTAGEQMEIDVIGIDSTDDEQVVYTCEVVTHLRGMLYSGTPSSDRWDEFGGSSHQHTLETIWDKFTADHGYVTDVFADADRYVFQLWSPVVPEGNRTDGLDVLTEEFKDEYGHEIELVINEEYTKRVEELRELAAEDEKNHGDPAFRFLQILEHLR